MTRPGRGSGSRAARHSSRLWWATAAVLLAVAVALALSRRDELRRAVELLLRVHPGKVWVAPVCEAVALLCLAGVQRWLLVAGGLRMTRTGMVPLVLAANAMSGALPGGTAFSAAWLYRQLRQRRAGQALAATVLVTAGALSAVGLFVVLVVGALTAGSRGPGAALLRVVTVLAVVAVLGLAVLRSATVRRALGARWRRLAARHGRLEEGSEALRQLVAHARSVQPGARLWLWPGALALSNWIFDAACLVVSLWVLGLPVPWSGLLLSYGLAQIPASARLTPGGVGLTEASLTGLLVVYGLQPGQAFAAAVLYRIWNYWLPQPVGWACWLGVTWRGRRRGGRGSGPGSREEGHLG